MVARALIVSLALTACPAPEGPADDGWPEMDTRDLLIRASLDLRGVRPTIDEYDRIEEDPTAIDDLIDDFIADPRFGDRMADAYAEVFLTRTEIWSVSAQTYGADITQADFVQSIGDEVPQMVAHIAREDLPFTELVIGDWTMANPALSQIWPVEPVNLGWQKSRYTDGRPRAGVLATNSLWWRYGSTQSNANRKRANAVSRVFLCQDYLHRPISFDRNVNLLDEGAVEDALRTDPGCVNCHVALDPLAGYFYGFWYYNDNLAAEVTHYHPERELLWEDRTGVAPAFYGEPGYGLEDLGWQLAADNRLVTCAVETVTEQFLRRETGLDDTSDLVEHREAFLNGDLTLRALARSVVDSETYRAGRTDDPRAVPTKLVTPDLLHDQITDLTGFRWTLAGGLDALGSEQVGFQTLAGGADGTFVTQSATRPNATLMLVHARLAEAAADYVVRADLADPDNAKLLTEVDGTETIDTDRDAMVRQIQFLHLRIFGTRIAADGDEVAANLGLWQDLHDVQDDPERAWVGVITALLRDPNLLLY
ncbi:MAG: DUF1549 domain-containing protein [Myxococcota bacterium]